MTVERGHLWGSGVGRRGEHLHAEGHAAMTEEREYLPMGSNQKQSTVISGTQLSLVAHSYLLLGAMTELIEMKMIWEYSRTRRCTVVCGKWWGVVVSTCMLKRIWVYSRTRRCTVVCEALGGSYE